MALPDIRKLTLYDKDDDWRDYAACLGRSPDLFFPSLGETARFAKAVCGECPVTEECFEYAMDTNQQFGVWGGRTTDDLRAERKRRRKDDRRRSNGQFGSD